MAEPVSAEPTPSPNPVPSKPESSPAPPALPDRPFDEKTASLTELGAVATMYAQSGMFKDVRSKAEAFTKMMVGRDLGIPSTRAMCEITMLQGKPTLSANLMAAMIKGSRKYKYKILEHTEQKCAIRFEERGEEGWEECGPPSTFTMEDAARAGLSSNQNWKKFPRNMLFSRAISNGAKQYCGDVFNGSVYTPDELDPKLELSEDGAVIDVSGSSRRPAARPAIAPVEPAPPVEETSLSVLQDVRELIARTGFDEGRFLKDNKVRALDDLDILSLKNIRQTLQIKLAS